MRYLKTYEKSGRVSLNFSVPLFPKANRDEGSWTTFTGGDSNTLQTRYYDIVWEKYENKKMPRSTLGLIRPEFKDYPIRLIDAITFLSDDPRVSDFNKSTRKKYWYDWSFGDYEDYPEKDKEEISNFTINFDNEEEGLDWLDNLNFLLNNSKEDFDDYVTAKKYNL